MAFEYTTHEVAVETTDNLRNCFGLWKAPYLYTVKMFQHKGQVTVDELATLEETLSNMHVSNAEIAIEAMKSTHQYRSSVEINGDGGNDCTTVRGVIISVKGPSNTINIDVRLVAATPTLPYFPGRVRDTLLEIGAWYDFKLT
jgi:hypothetical protein